MERKYPYSRAQGSLPNPPVGVLPPSQSLGASSTSGGDTQGDSPNSPSGAHQFASSAITRSRVSAAKSLDVVGPSSSASPTKSCGNTPVSQDVLPSIVYRVRGTSTAANTMHRASTADQNGLTSKVEVSDQKQNGRRVNARTRSDTEKGNSPHLPGRLLQQPFSTPLSKQLESQSPPHTSLETTGAPSRAAATLAAQKKHLQRQQSDTDSTTGSCKESPGRRTTSRALNPLYPVDQPVDSLEHSKTLEPPGTTRRRFTERAAVKSPNTANESGADSPIALSAERSINSSDNRGPQGPALTSSPIVNEKQLETQQKPQRVFPPRIVVSLHGGQNNKAPPISTSSSKNSESGVGYAASLFESDSEPRTGDSGSEPARYAMQNVSPYERAKVQSTDSSEALSVEKGGVQGNAPPVDYVPFHSFRTTDGGEGVQSSRCTPSYGPALPDGGSANISANTPSVFGTYSVPPPRGAALVNRNAGNQGGRRTDNSSGPTTSFIGVPPMRANSHHVQNEFGISARDRSEEIEAQFGDIVGPNRRASIDMLQMLYQPLPPRSTPPLRTWSHGKGVPQHPSTEPKSKEQLTLHIQDIEEEAVTGAAQGKIPAENKGNRKATEASPRTMEPPGGVRPESAGAEFIQMQPTMIMQQDEIVIDDGLGMDGDSPQRNENRGDAKHFASDKQDPPPVSLESPTHVILQQSRDRVIAKGVGSDDNYGAEPTAGAIPSSSPMMPSAPRSRQFGGAQRQTGNERPNPKTGPTADGTAPLDQIYNSIVEFYKVFRGNDAPMRVPENATLDAPEMITNTSKDLPTHVSMDAINNLRGSPAFRGGQELISREPSHDRPLSPPKNPSTAANDRLHRRMSTKTSFFVNVDENADTDGPAQADNQTIGKLVNRALESFFNPDTDASMAPSLSMWRRSRDSRVFRSTRSMLTVGGDNNFSRLISFKTYDSSRGFGRDMDDDDDDDECDEPLNVDKMKQIVAGAQAMFASMSGKGAMSVSKSDTLPMGQFSPEMLRQIKMPDPRPPLATQSLRAGAPPGSFITLDSAACLTNREDSDFSRAMDDGVGPLSMVPERPSDALTAMRNAAALEMFRSECEKQHKKKVLGGVVGISSNFTGFGAGPSKGRGELDSFGDALVENTNNNHNNNANKRGSNGRPWGQGKTLDDTLRSMSLDSRSMDHRTSSKTDVFDTFRVKDAERDAVAHLPTILDGEDIISVGDTMGTSTPAASATWFGTPKQMSPRNRKSVPCEDDDRPPVSRRKTDKPLSKDPTPSPDTTLGASAEKSISPFRDLPLESTSPYSTKRFEQRKPMPSGSPEPQDQPAHSPPTAAPRPSAGSPSLLDRTKHRTTTGQQASSPGGVVRSSTEMGKRQGTSSPSGWSESTNRTEVSPSRGFFNRPSSNYFSSEAGGTAPRPTPGAQFRSATSTKASMKALMDDETLKRCILIELEKQLFIRTVQLIKSLYVSAAVKHAHSDLHDEDRASPSNAVGSGGGGDREPNTFGHAFNMQRATPSPRMGVRGSVGGAEGILRRSSVSENANARSKRPPSSLVPRNGTSENANHTTHSAGSDTIRNPHPPEAHKAMDHIPSEDLPNAYGPTNPEYPIFPISSVAAPRRVPYSKMQEQHTLSSNKLTVPPPFQADGAPSNRAKGGAPPKKDTKETLDSKLATTVSSSQLSPLLFNPRTATLPTLGPNSPRTSGPTEKRSSQSETHSDSILTPAPISHAHTKNFRPRPVKPERLSLSNRLSSSDSNSISNGKKTSKRRKPGEKQSPKLRSGSKGGRTSITTPKETGGATQSAFLTFESKDKQIQKAFKSNGTTNKSDGVQSNAAPSFDPWNYSYASLQTAGGPQESDSKGPMDKQGKAAPLQELIRSRRSEQSATLLAGTTYGGTSRDYFGFDDENEDEKPPGAAVKGNPAGGNGDSIAGKMNGSVKNDKNSVHTIDSSAEMAIDSKNDYDDRDESQFEYDLRGVNSLMPALDTTRKSNRPPPRDSTKSVSPSGRRRSEVMVYTPLATTTGVFGKTSTDSSSKRTVTTSHFPSETDEYDDMDDGDEDDEEEDDEESGEKSELQSKDSLTKHRLTRAGTRRPSERSPASLYNLPVVGSNKDKVVTNGKQQQQQSKQRSRISTADEELDEDALLSTEQLSAVVEQLYPLVSHDSTLDGLPRGKQRH